MLEEFKKKPELAERISIFLATKPDTPSSNMKLKFNSSIMNSTTGRYYLLLIKHLYKGKHFGEAARQADIEAKKIDEWDAEAVINGNLITINKPISLDNIIGTV